MKLNLILPNSLLIIYSVSSITLVNGNNEVSSAKKLGLAGSLLRLIWTLIALVIFITSEFTWFELYTLFILSFIIDLLGMGLIYGALSKLSKPLKDHNILNYYLRYFGLSVLSLVAVLTGILLGLASIAGYGSNIGIVDLVKMFFAFGVVVVLVIIAWIMFITATYYLFRSYDLVKKYTGIKAFETTGVLYFIGAALSIIGIGRFLSIVGMITEVIAWALIPKNTKGES